MKYQFSTYFVSRFALVPLANGAKHGLKELPVPPGLVLSAAGDCVGNVGEYSVVEEQCGEVGRLLRVQHQHELSAEESVRHCEAAARENTELKELSYAAVACHTRVKIGAFFVVYPRQHQLVVLCLLPQLLLQLVYHCLELLLLLLLLAAVQLGVVVHLLLQLRNRIFNTIN